jgi:nitronate monooxygenase
VAEAKHLEQAGIDAIIAQGWEAGGHRGSQKPVAPMDGVGTMALVPQIVDAVRVPVIAAGGIADGRGIAAALLLGASGVQIGTGFLRCPEAGTDMERRKLLAVASDTDTIVTDSVSGRTARTHRSRYTEAMEETRRRLPAYPAMYDLSDPLTEAGQDDVASFHLYGQAAALARELPAGELISILLAEASYALRRGAVVGSHAL